jgi:sulfur carrier protein
LKITLNGKQSSVEDGCTLADLIRSLELRQDRLAVEVNGNIMRRAEWSATAISDGDRIEIVHFVGGG